jgi:hypothetical protein
MRITGWIGVAVLLIAEVLLFQGNEFVGKNMTPIQWWGYIFLIDAIIERKWKKSYIFQYPGEFIAMMIYSFGCWLVYEFYNIYYIKNWYYTMLPEHWIPRWAGYFVAFSTVFPGIFLTTRFLESCNLFKSWHIKGWKINRSKLYMWSIAGLLFLIFPFIYSSPYIFAIVWLGFALLLDPINYLLGYKSILKEFEEGRISLFLNLMLGGYICGFLWEFWNYWALRKWIYTVPFTPHLKIFEMPLAGFSGFGPFAVECFCMWAFLRGITGAVVKRMKQSPEII